LHESSCFVPYGELPPGQQHKDALFVTVVRAMAAALGLYCRAPGRSS